jgi:flagellar assembly factor FliW
VILKTGRFGELNLDASELIEFPLGVVGFPELKRFCMVDPGDETLILWLQSVDRPEWAFPVLEPKIFKPDYRVKLSANEKRELNLASLKDASVFSILTIPSEIADMTANLKAPIVVNLKNSIAKQVVLQETEYEIKFSMFKELRARLLMNAGIKASTDQPQILHVADLPSSENVSFLGA